MKDRYNAVPPQTEVQDCPKGCVKFIQVAGVKFKTKMQEIL